MIIQLETGQKIEVQGGATPHQIDEVLAHVSGAGNAAPLQGNWGKYGQPFVDTFKQGVNDLGDFATMNYSDKHPMQNTLRQKRGAGTADRHDYERAFMEGAANSPGGKILGAAGGIIPEFNVVTTALGKWINPAIVDQTGIDPTELQLGEMVAAPAAGKAIKSLPSAKAAGTVADSVSHPIETSGKLIGGSARLAAKAAKPIVQPVVRGIIEGDNPITGEAGLKTALASETATEGTRLGDKLSVNFSAGELTGNPTAMGIEDALANSARWGGKFAEANRQKVDAIVGKFNETLAKIYPQATSRGDVGDRIASAYNGTIDNLVKARRKQAKVDAQAAGIATKGQAVIDPNNFVQALKDFIEEGRSPTATPAQKEASKQAVTLLNNLKAPAPKQSGLVDQNGNPVRTQSPGAQYKKITVRDLQNGLAAFGDGAKVGGGIWRDISTASDRRFSIAAKDALQRDLDAAADSGLPEAASLKAFRDNYRENSNRIADIQKTTLGKLVGGAEHDSQGNLVVSPEKMADRFTAMEPAELKNTLGFLDKHHPDVAQMARRYTLEKALRQAEEGRGQRGQGTTKDFAKAEFVKNLPDDTKLNALMKNTHAANDVRDVAAAINRMIDYGAQRKGSPTAQRTDFLASIAKWGKGALYRAIVSDSLAEDLLNPAKRRQIAFEARRLKPAATPITSKKAAP